MDRYEWTNGALLHGETHVKQQPGVRLFDGPDKTAFDKGIAILTTHRLFWRDAVQQATMFALPLAQVVYAEEVPDGRGKSPKIAVHLHPVHAAKVPGPVMSTVHSYIQMSFKDAGETEGALLGLVIGYGGEEMSRGEQLAIASLLECLTEEISRKRWELTPAPTRTAPRVPGAKPKPIHAGIVGIERKLDEKRKETDQNISKAFEDLDKLMEKAKEMVNLSKTIANKIKDKQGEITEDETIQFKSYLLSLGIANPVTRDTHGTGLKYHKELAKQLSDVLLNPIEESGGMMALTDIYCRVNRARGMELMSPDDLVDACRQFEPLKLPLRLREFSSGVMVVELVSRGEEETIKHIADLLTEKGSLTSDELSQSIGISVTLAKQRLMTAEETGQACRDESVEGLRFYPNLFLNPQPTR